MFGKKKEDEKPSTLEEVQKAYEDLSDDDKKAFHQSIADHVHESIAAQESEHGQEDGQSAEAREHEALGEEHADGNGEVEELHESDDTAEEKSEDKHDEAVEADSSQSDENRDEIVNRLTERVGVLEDALKELGELKERMEEYTRKQEEHFGLKGKAVGGMSKDMKDMSADELKSAILSGKN